MNKKTELIILVFVLLLAAFFRLYRIDAYMTFLGDEGRDALVVKDTLTNRHFPLLGPPMSVTTGAGNIYLGPLYYYMMALSMAIFWLNPVGAAVMVALIGVATVGLIYYLARQWFGFWPAVVSSTLYAVSPVTITYSRSSWNPNPLPFFTLIAMFSIFKARTSKNFLWFILAGISLAFAAQMHWLALILLPVFGIYWALEFFQRQGLKNFWQGTAGAVAAFLFLMSPLLIFDLRHNFMNYKALTAFFGGGQTAGLNLLDGLTRIWQIYYYGLTGRYLSVYEFAPLNLLLAILVLVPVAVFAYQKYNGKKLKWWDKALVIWLVVGILGLSIYKGLIYDHYLGFLNPLPFLLFGSLFAFVNLMGGRLARQVSAAVLALLTLVLVALSLQKNPLQYPPNNQLERTQRIAKFVIEQSGNKPFNFALLAQRNYDAAYQYYLDLYGHKPKQAPFEKTGQLFVVCEDPVCKPINNPKYEIAAFGMSKVESEQDFSGIKVYKLIPNPSGKP